jgi:hypothetical protein
MFANQIMDPYGRKTAVQINAVSVAIGSLLLSSASSVGMLVLGRYEAVSVFPIPVFNYCHFLINTSCGQFVDF